MMGIAFKLAVAGTHLTLDAAMPSLRAVGNVAYAMMLTVTSLKVISRAMVSRW